MDDSKWVEIRIDHFDDIANRWCVDAWETGDDNEEGKTIAYIEMEGPTVNYLDPEASFDEYAQEEIRSKMKELFGVKTFTCDSEAKEYGKGKKYGEYFSKYVWERVKVGDEDVILCGTCLPFEDKFYGFAEDAVAAFELDEELIPEVRDEMIAAFEKICKVRFLVVSDTF